MPSSRTGWIAASVGFFLLGGVIALEGEHILFKSADARDTMQTMSVIKDWRITCPPRADRRAACALQQEIVQKGTSNVLVQLNVGKTGDKDTLAIVTPLGVLVPPGLRFIVGDGQPRTAPYKTCLQAGCIATLPLDASLAAAMTHNKAGRIVVVNGASQAVPLNYSLAGFAEAYETRAADEKLRRGGW
jgi:invasion protein IalB